MLRDKHGIFSEMRRRYQVEHEGITEEQVEMQGYLYILQVNQPRMCAIISLITANSEMIIKILLDLVSLTEEDKLRVRLSKIE